MKKLLVSLLLLLISISTAKADLTGTEGLAIDLSSAGAGTDFTIAFDPTELLGNRTWGDGSTDTIVWTWNRATGTDPTITFNSGSIALPALTLTTDLAVAHGGTGASSLNDGFVLLGNSTSAIQCLDVTTDGGIIIGDGTTDPVVLDVGSSAGITILGTIATGVWQGTAIADGYVDNNITIDLATLATTVTVEDETTDTTCFPAFVTAATGSLGAKTAAVFTFNSNTGSLGATEFVGGGAGLTAVDAATGDSATDFFDAGEIADARISNTLTASSCTGNSATVTTSDNEDQNEEDEIPFVADAAGPGSAALESDSGFTYNPSTGTLTTAEFSGGGGSLTGVDAATGDSATDFFDAGEIADARVSDTLTSSSCTGTAAIATGVTCTDNENEALACPIVFVDGATGTQGAETDDTDFTYTPSTGTLQTTAITTTSNIKSEPKHLRFNLFNPSSLYDTDTQICVWPLTDAAVTITKIEVTCDADPDTELDFDLKWADAFIGLANAAVIDEMNTTSGTTSIDAGFDDATVASGKCIYVEFQADPDSAIKQAAINITYDYD